MQLAMSQARFPNASTPFLFIQSDRTGPVGVEAELQDINRMLEANPQPRTRGLLEKQKRLLTKELKHVRVDMGDVAGSMNVYDSISAPEHQPVFTTTTSG